MRYQNYLTEAKAMSIKQFKAHPEWKYGYDDSLNQEADFFSTVKKVKKECKYAIDLVRKTDEWFYRGVSGVHDKSGERSVRQDRRPKDTDPYVHKMFDSMLEELFGWKARSQGLFVTTNWEQSKDFGYNMIVFPVGKFDYVWSPKQEDSIEVLQDGSIVKKFAEQYKEQLMPWVDTENGGRKRGSLGAVARMHFNDGIKGESPHKWVNDAIRDIVEKIVVDDLDYSDTNIEKAMNSGHEIMVRAPKYYYFDSSYNTALSMLLGKRT